MQQSIYEFSKDSYAWYADELINDSKQNIFLTGKAGTGKSKLLRQLIKNTHKKSIVLAPTGVAAANIEGSTFHNFFGLPNGFLDVNGKSKVSRLSKLSREVIMSLEILFMDEASMIRADLLDTIDFVLKQVRNDERPFGGVQVVIVGDLYQLPPVVSKEDKARLLTTYKSPYFFDAKVFEQLDILKVGLEIAHRQVDSEFICLLDKVRTNKITSSELARLNTRSYIPSPASVTTLTTRKYIADIINAEELKRLYGGMYTLKSISKGDWKGEKPFEDTLYLKEGAKIMFTKNNYTGTFYNGMTGTVKKIDQRRGLYIVTENNEFWVDRMSWKYEEYVSVDGNIEKICKGEYLQYPLTLGYGMTIHKSQGLTLDQVNIDLGTGAFAEGQVYVALSRCKSLNGLFLKNMIKRSDIKTDRRISDFLADVNGPKIKTALREIAIKEASDKEALKLQVLSLQ